MRDIKFRAWDTLKNKMYQDVAFAPTSQTNSAKDKLGENFRVYRVKTKDGSEAFLLLDGDSVIDEELRYFEGMAYKIDKHWLIRRKK